MSLPCACTHAKANWAEVQPFLVAYSKNGVCMFLAKFSSEKRGKFLRRSFSPSWSREVNVADSNPRPRGEYATIPTPSSRAVGITSASYISRLQRVLHLSSGHRMYGVSPAELGRCALGQPNVSDLSLLHQLLQTLHGLFDGSAGVHAVLVVEVYVICAQPLEGVPPIGT